MKINKLIILLSLLINSCNQTEENLYLIKENNKFGYINDKGIVIIKPQYSYACEFHEGIAYVRFDSIIGYVNKKGVFKFFSKLPKVKTLFGNDSIFFNPFREFDPFKIKQGLDYSCLLYSNYENLPYSYESDFSDGSAVWNDLKTKKYGYVDKRGKFIISPIYLSARRFIDGLARIKTDSGWGVINKKGELILKNEYSNITDCSNGFIIGYKPKEFVEDGRAFYGYNCFVFNMKGQMVNGPQGMVRIEGFHEGIAVENNISMKIFTGLGKTFIDTNLSSVTEYYFDDAKEFSQGLAAIKLNGKWGFLNYHFEMLTDFKYDNIQAFNEGFAAVKLYKWGFIDKNDSLVIDFKFDSCTSFKKGLAYVWLNQPGYSIEGYINTSGNLVWFHEN